MPITCDRLHCGDTIGPCDDCPGVSYRITPRIVGGASRSVWQPQTVASLTEARRAVNSMLLAWNLGHPSNPNIGEISEAGGDVALPDGTVIEVRRV